MKWRCGTRASPDMHALARWHDRHGAVGGLPGKGLHCRIAVLGWSAILINAEDATTLHRVHDERQGAHHKLSDMVAVHLRTA